MKTKYMVMGLVVGLQLVSGYSYVTEASWLSKTWTVQKRMPRNNLMIGPKLSNILTMREDKLQVLPCQTRI